MPAALEREIRVADEAWVALALLHREHPGRASFTAGEIVSRAQRESSQPIRPGVQAHVYLHNVSNLAPNSARYRMFVRLDDDTYRLYRPGDPVHPARKGKTAPQRSQLPEAYQTLLDWYEREYCAKNERSPQEDDPILKLWGLGKEIWSETTADEYVSSLRAGWEEEQVDDVWERIKEHQGQKFRTVRGLPFKYKVEGNGVRFSRHGRRIHQILSRTEIEKALARAPLKHPVEIKDLRDSSYLFALLSDPRISGPR